ncbi:LWamide neuropeptides-like [Brassica rapa]|uniref:LWamide neuropeptides-like n=1 Tax=Brassica campestris TaxID=3711 RepID=UPI00142E4762|nr:LWamide neuropeptides-like [Brassica rapa]XP_033140462.1 LWamide neuropeptides-like [Brassica rapa]
MEVPKNTKFYWACIQAFKDDRFWRKYFIDRADNSSEDKLQFLQALTGYTRDSEFVGKRLASGQNSGNPNLSGSFSGSPSSGGNNSWGRTSGGPLGNVSQQWGTPPNVQQWGSSSNVPQWGTPPNVPQWGSSSNVPQWGTPPNAPQWGSSSNGPQWGSSSNVPWGTPPNAQQWGSSPNVPQWGTPPNAQQWGSSSNVQQWGSSSNIPQWGTPPNVQRGFSVGPEAETNMNNQQRDSLEAEGRISANLHMRVSPEFGFTNYSSEAQIPRSRRRGGLFNIWGKKQGPNLNESHQSESEDED